MGPGTIGAPNPGTRDSEHSTRWSALIPHPHDASYFVITYVGKGYLNIAAAAVAETRDTEPRGWVGLLIDDSMLQKLLRGTYVFREMFDGFKTAWMKMRNKLPLHGLSRLGANLVRNSTDIA